MIVLVLLAIVQQSYGAIPMIRNIMDPQIIAFDDVEGFLYDVPEYEDPLLIQHQLSSIGAMPIFTLLESAKKRGNSKMDDLPEKVRIAESKKLIDDVMIRLEMTRAKLEKGNGNIYTDVEKVVQRLKTLEKSFRPDIRHTLNSLQSMMAMARPLMEPEIKELITTSEPESYEKSEAFEKPQGIDRQALSVRVIPDYKPESDEKLVSDVKPEFEEKPASNTPDNSSESVMSAEKKLEEEKVKEGSSQSFESSEISKEKGSYEATKPPFEFKLKERKTDKYDGDDMVSSYKAKITWKAAGLV